MLAALLAVGALATLFAGARLLCPDGHCQALPIDTASLARLHDWRSPGLDAAFAAVTWLGSFIVLLPLALACAWWQRKTLYRTAAAFVPVALCSAALLSWLAKHAIERPRPDLFQAVITMPADPAFPSGHAIHAAAFALAVLIRPGPDRSFDEVLRLALPLGLLVLLIALSRLYLQVHFASDVIFGIAAALLWVTALRCLPVWSEPAR